MPKKSAPKAVAPRLLSVWGLTKQTAVLLVANWRLLLTITAIYGLLSIVLVHGLASTTNVSDLKRQLGSAGVLTSSLSVFVVLAGSNSGNANSGAAYQFFLSVIASLALIWALRQIIAGKKIRARDAFYSGMQPLVPFILVLAVCGLQLLPLVIGSSLYSLVLSTGVAVNIFEKLTMLAVFLALAAVSFYWLTSSLMALYIVALPDMRPVKALRTARELVRGRRVAVLGRIICLPVVLMIVAAVIMVPVIIVAAPVAPWLFFGLTILALPAVHAYLYGLYRGLIND